MSCQSARAGHFASCERERKCDRRPIALAFLVKFYYINDNLVILISKIRSERTGCYSARGVGVNYEVFFFLIFKSVLECFLFFECVYNIPAKAPGTAGAGDSANMTYEVCLFTSFLESPTNSFAFI